MEGTLRQFLFLTPGWRDSLEIALVALIAYRILLLARETRAMDMAAGILVLGLVYALSFLFGLNMIRQLLGALLTYGAIAVVILFQPELRAALRRLGGNPLARFLRSPDSSRLAEQLASAVEQLSEDGVGAIIAVQRRTGLRDYVQSGILLDAGVSPAMLGALFATNAPTHDGAVIVQGDRIRAAGVILPLTMTPLPDRSLGTRHRAAIGLSEETDALVLVVSEESRRISVANRGKLQVGLDSKQLRARLSELLPDAEAQTEAEPRASVA